ncbi:hypothetical protein OAB00_03780 [Akkermansiaceae bacterium]|nr:hypothetical protein [Akkermansiaceae bacterium]
MNKIIRISSTTPLSLANINDPKHRRECFRGFGRGIATLAAPGELEALSFIVNEHKGAATRNRNIDQLLWSYSLHKDQGLADLAFSALPSNHTDTAVFMSLTPVRRRSLIRLLIEKLNDSSNDDLCQLTESIANRGLGSDENEEIVLAARLFALVISISEVVRLLPLEVEKVSENRFAAVSNKKKTLFSQSIRTQLLYKILIYETVAERQVYAEEALASYHHMQADCIYRYGDLEEVTKTLAYLASVSPNEQAKTYAMIMAWRVHQFEGLLMDTRAEVRVLIENFLYLNSPSELKQSIDKDLFRVDKELQDREGDWIEYTVTRARIGAMFFPMTVESFEFYHNYRDEELGKRAVKFLDESCTEKSMDEYQPVSVNRDWVDQMVIEMIETFPFNVRRLLAASSLQCDVYFHLFLHPGLPLYALDAIHQVNWEGYKKNALFKDIEKAISYLSRIANLNPTMQQDIREKFGVEPQSKILKLDKE